MGLSRDRDVSSVLSGYRDMRGHDQAIEAAKRRAREREAYRKKAQKDEADLRAVMLYTAPEREPLVPSAPSAPSAPRAAKKRKKNRHEVAAEEDAAYMRKKRAVDAAGLRLIESEDEEDEPILNATRIVAAMERRTERPRPGRPEEKRDAEKGTELAGSAGPAEKEAHPVNVEPTQTKMDPGVRHAEKTTRTRSEIPISGSAPRPAEPVRIREKTPDDIGTANHDAAVHALCVQTITRAEKTVQAPREAQVQWSHVPQAETPHGAPPAEVSTSDRDTMTDVSIKSDRGTMTDVSTEIYDLKKKVNDLVESTRDAQDRANGAKEESRARQTTIDQLLESSAKITDLNAATLLELDKTKVEAEAYLTRAEALQRRLDESTEQSDSLLSDRERAKTESDVRDSEQISKIYHLRLILDTATRDIKDKEDAIASMQASLEKVETSEATLRATSHTQATQNSDLRASLDRMTTDLSAANARYKEIQSSIAQFANDQKAIVAESSARTKKHLDEIGELQSKIDNSNRIIRGLEEKGTLQLDEILVLRGLLDGANERLNRVGESLVLSQTAPPPGSAEERAWHSRVTGSASTWALSIGNGTCKLAAMIVPIVTGTVSSFYSVRRVLPKDTIGAVCDKLYAILEWMVGRPRRGGQNVQPRAWVVGLVGQYLEVVASAMLTLLLVYVLCTPNDQAQIAPKEHAQIAAVNVYSYRPEAMIQSSSWTRGKAQWIPSFILLPLKKDTNGILRTMVEFLMHDFGFQEQPQAPLLLGTGEAPSGSNQVEPAPLQLSGSPHGDGDDASLVVVNGAGDGAASLAADAAGMEEPETAATTQDEKATKERRKNKRVKPAKAAAAALETEAEETKKVADAAAKQAAAKKAEETKKAEEENAAAAAKKVAEENAAEETKKVAEDTKKAERTKQAAAEAETKQAAEAAQKKATEAAQKKATEAADAAQKKATEAAAVTDARKLTAWATLGEENQQRLLTQLHLYHVAAVIVGSTTEGEFATSVNALKISISFTSPVTLVRNIMVHTEELLGYVAANKPNDAIRILDEDLTNGNQYPWPLTAGKYTIAAEVLEKLNAATTQTVKDNFPVLRHVKGSIAVNKNGLFDECHPKLKARCDLLADLYRGYAGTTNYNEKEVKKVLVASLVAAKARNTGNPALGFFDWTIADINEGKIDMLSVIIAATAHLGERCVIVNVNILIVYYHVQIMRIPKAATDPVFIAAIKYTEELVKKSSALGARPNNAQYVCNLARTLKYALESLTEEDNDRALQFRHTHRIIARTWVDREYLDEYESLRMDASKQVLYDEATGIVDGMKESLRGSEMDYKKILASIKKALNDNKRIKEAEDKERKEAQKKSDKRVAENDEVERTDYIRAYIDALKAFGINFVYDKTWRRDDLHARSIKKIKEKYSTHEDFKSAYIKAVVPYHPDKQVRGDKGKENKDRIYLAIGDILEKVKDAWKSG